MPSILKPLMIGRWWQIGKSIAAPPSPRDAVPSAIRREESSRWLELLRSWGGQFRRDCQYAVRGLIREPRFTAVAMLTLAFGIGANTVIFSVLDDLIISPAGRNRDAHLVVVYTAQKGRDRNYRPFSYAEFEVLTAATDVFTKTAAVSFSYVVIGRAEEARQSLFCMVSGNYFPLLGVQPWKGRFFSPEESRPDADIPVLVASYSMWQRMGEKPDIVGSHVLVNGRSFEVIGVTPRGFGGLQWAIGPEAWLPLGVRSSLEGAPPPGAHFDPNRDWMNLNVIASLGPGLSLKNSAAVVGLLSSRLNRLAVANKGREREVVIGAPSRSNLDLTAPTDESAFSTYAAMAIGLSIAVLMVACLNVANMLLARGMARRKEIAIRLAIGAQRGRIVAQLLTEGMVLSLGGGLIAILLTRIGRAVFLNVILQASAGQKFVVHHQAAMNVGLLLGACGVCLVATLLCSLGPALRATNLNLVDDLKQQSGDASGTGSWNRFFSVRHCVVMAQVALSLVLLVSSGLLARCATGIENSSGFSRNGLVANFNFALDHTSRADTVTAQRLLVEAARSVPGVTRVALASSVPYNFETSLVGVFPAKGSDFDGSAGAQSERPARIAIFTAVSQGYFETLGIPLLRGRDFDERETLRDEGPRVGIIDERLAAVLFPGRDPLGQRIVTNKAYADGRHPDQEIEIIGIVRSPREDPMSRELPWRLYRPSGQAVESMTYVHVDTPRPAAVLPALRRKLAAVDPNRPLLYCGPLAAIVDNNLDLWSIRLAAILFAIFGAVALFLTVTGVYGVKAYSIARRTREIGVRLAIGAEPRMIIAMVVKQGLLQSLVGIGIGLLFSILAGIALSRLLFGVAPVDPAVILVSIGALVMTVIFACLVPALRAARIKPAEALRTE